MRENHPERLEKMKIKIHLGLVVGIFTAFIGSIIWALISVISIRQVAWFSVVIALFVCGAIYKWSKGRYIYLCIIGSLLTILGSILGNYFAMTLALSNWIHRDILYALKYIILNPMYYLEMIKITHTNVDLLFYILSISICFILPYYKTRKENKLNNE